MRTSLSAALGLLAALAATGCAVEATTEPATSAVAQTPLVTPRGALGRDEQAIVDLFERVSPAVVYITTLAERPNVFGLTRATPQGTGTGFLWDLNGHVVTNYHVLQDATRAQVVLFDQSAHDADYIGGSARHDLAVLRINPPAGIEQITIGDSESLRVGQSIFAIGNPFGLSATLSTGIVAALGRRIQSVDDSPIEDVIQIDATINPGNSGGPLLDSAGRVVGVNTAIASRTGDSSGIGFAVPIDTVRRVVPRLIATGEYRSPSLGIGTMDRLSRSIVRRLGTSGVLVFQVEPGGAAAAAGIRPAQVRGNNVVPGDVIQAIDGRAVGTLQELQTALDRYEPGAVVTVTIWRNGRTAEVPVTLG